MRMLGTPEEDQGMDKETDGQAIAKAINNLAAAIREHTAAITQESEEPEYSQITHDLAGNPID